jgi:hypothetical protein
MPEPPCWYVSYTVQLDRSPRRNARMIKTFDTEVHAKLFAREIAANSLRLTAGTINPHSPKKVIHDRTSDLAGSSGPAWLLRRSRTNGIGKALLISLSAQDHCFRTNLSVPCGSIHPRPR